MVAATLEEWVEITTRTPLETNEQRQEKSEIMRLYGTREWPKSPFMENLLRNNLIEYRVKFASNEFRIEASFEPNDDRHPAVYEYSIPIQHFRDHLPLRQELQSMVRDLDLDIMTLSWHELKDIQNYGLSACLHTANLCFLHRYLTMQAPTWSEQW